MKLLAIDCATEQMNLALVAGDSDTVLNAEGGALSSARLIPALLGLLDRAGLRVADLDAIAFGQGPGAFTGLRTAASVAQGLAFGAGLPVLAIDSLLIVAEDLRHSLARAGAAASGVEGLWVAMDARIEQVYAAAYRHDGQAWQVEQAPALYDLGELLSLWRAHPPRHLAGSALAAFGERLPVEAAAIAPPTADRASALARLARAAWRAGAVLPAEQALPLYLRDKVAQTSAEREALRMARGWS